MTNNQTHADRTPGRADHNTAASARRSVPARHLDEQLDARAASAGGPCACLDALNAAAEAGDLAALDTSVGRLRGCAGCHPHDRIFMQEELS